MQGSGQLLTHEHVRLGQADKDGSSDALSKSMLRIIRDRTGQVQIHGTQIPVTHPHLEPYRYLGVDITPTFNWGPHVNRVLSDAKQRADRLLGYSLSKAQMVKVLKTAIDPSITDSFAIGCMAEADINKLDAIRTRTCKRILGMPVSTQSAMVHLDTEQAGLGLPSLMFRHAEVSCRYLVQALIDHGSLGYITQNLLLLQGKAVGVTLQQKSSRKRLRRTSHYHLTRQLAILQNGNAHLTFPVGHAGLNGNSLSELLAQN